MHSGRNSSSDMEKGMSPSASPTPADLEAERRPADGNDDDGMPGDVFGCEEGHEIKYKTLSWPLVATLMITEIVSYGLFGLPSFLAAVGLIPGIAVIFFLGIFATYTARALIHFKLRHPAGKYTILSN